ncbi:MAG: asparagine synthase C-terminal domain-containing protein [Candidatus Thorarchaeota archaeon]
MTKRLSHRGPLSIFSEKLPAGMIRFGLLSESPFIFKNKFDDRFVKHILIDKCHEFTTFLPAEVLRILDSRDQRSDIFATQMINAVGITEDNQIRVFRSVDGARPLYYAELEYGIALSSEKKGIWEITEEKPKIFNPGTVLTVSEDGTWEFEKIQSYIRSERKFNPVTISKVSDIRPPEYKRTEIELAQMMTAHSKPPEYWEEDDIESFTLHESQTERSFILDNLSGSLRSIIPLRLKLRICGVLFSGGVDSSLLAMRVKSVAGLKGTRLISVTAPESIDTKITKRAAHRLSATLYSGARFDHTIVPFDEETVWNILPEVIYAIETTRRMDVEISIPFFLAARWARDEGIKILLSGQGPDELFAGYARYEKSLIESGAEKVEEELWSDFSVTHENNIVRDEKAIAYHGINSLFPFLDAGFCNLAFAIPIEYLLDPSAEPSRKIIFREVAKWFGVPEEIANAQKRATQFSSGSTKMLRNAVKKYVEDAKDLNKKEMSILTIKVIHTIASEIGIPGARKPIQQLVMDMKPTQRLIERVGRLPTRNLG